MSDPPKFLLTRNISLITLKIIYTTINKVIPIKRHSVIPFKDIQYVVQPKERL